MQIISVWIILRIITSLIAATASTLRPITELENRIPLWPPIQLLADWFERVFISPWNRWDAIWYTRIITEGYHPENGTTNFHPLYPWLGKLLYIFNIHPLLSLMIISSTATLLLLYLYKKLAALDLNEEQTNLSILLFLLFPVAFILFAPYPESLFLMFSISCFYWMRKKNWFLAGVSASLAVFTRQQGIFLIFPLIWELWESSRRNFRVAISQWRRWMTLVLIPLAFLSWSAYRLAILNDGDIELNDLQSMIYSIFISPSTREVVPVQEFILPWNSIYLGLMKIFESPDVDIWLNLFLAIVFLLFLFISWKNLNPGYRIYTLIITFVSISFYTGPIHPFMGLPRHLYLAFPIFIGITPRIANNNLTKYAYPLFGIFAMSILIVAYTLLAWVP